MGNTSTETTDEVGNHFESPMCDLPSEILRLIFSFLRLEEIYPNIVCVCREFYEACEKSEYFWKCNTESFFEENFDPRSFDLEKLLVENDQSWKSVFKFLHEELNFFDPKTSVKAIIFNKGKSVCYDINAFQGYSRCFLKRTIHSDMEFEVSIQITSRPSRSLPNNIKFGICSNIDFETDSRFRKKETNYHQDLKFLEIQIPSSNVFYGGTQLVQFTRGVGQKHVANGDVITMEVKTLGGSKRNDNFLNNTISFCVHGVDGKKKYALKDFQIYNSLRLPYRVGVVFEKKWRRTFHASDNPASITIVNFKDPSSREIVHLEIIDVQTSDL